MLSRCAVILSLTPLVVLLLLRSLPSSACCPASPAGKHVVNADQTVIMIWDAEQKTQHFIRQASFKSDADDIGFLVPTPSVPELEESGNDAFPLLTRVTAPEIRRVPRPRGGAGCGCGLLPQSAAPPTSDGVAVLAEKRVAGFDAQVLEATSAEELVKWLNEHGYAFSPEVEAWAAPYVRDGWKITALKVAKDAERKDEPNFQASALRISFQTERPLFPYREPDPTESAKDLNVRQRLLRIFFIADSRYRGELTPENPWTGRVAWSDKMNAADRASLLEKLKLPATTGPAEYWLTEFEDYWPYRAAPADVYFSKDAEQKTRRRDPIIQYVQSRSGADVSLALLAAAVVGPLVWTRWRSKK